MMKTLTADNLSIARPEIPHSVLYMVNGPWRSTEAEAEADLDTLQRGLEALAELEKMRADSVRLYGIANRERNEARAAARDLAKALLACTPNADEAYARNEGIIARWPWLAEVQ